MITASMISNAKTATCEKCFTQVGNSKFKDVSDFALWLKDEGWSVDIEENKTYCKKCKGKIQ